MNAIGAFVNAAHCPLRLKIEADALTANWRWLAGLGGPAACGAAIKADGYGLGAREVAMHLVLAGCRDFFVSTWSEAERVLPWLGEAALSVLHGVSDDELRTALALRARPVLNTPAQVQRWRAEGQGRPCDVMIDSGFNRLGLSPGHLAEGILEGLAIETLMSHLASADEDVEMNGRQREMLVGVAANVGARRVSLANSAGICLGRDYHFDLTRPGIALYGGIPRPEAENHLRQVVRIEAQIVQRRRVGRGDPIGYNATFVADRDMELAILNIGYADGYLRAFSGAGRAVLGDAYGPVVGRISMDLTTICVDAAPHLAEGDWVEMDFNLPAASAQSGLSQYELLTLLGSRYDRIWF
ncbi:alanine racemase [Sphingosinicella rhizophila]|uniref:alanine racemase n=1 Tax=Sphingosinicella rhizophila TaxID=3050082 RepID=A0ABU3Q8U8_9SPHN|nr:alanine racemase [Sphingosinicella sp. GR2756]MDT9599835.1 alanine racemase [Sphingosinicella sp. GR2756]